MPAEFVLLTSIFDETMEGIVMRQLSEAEMEQVAGGLAPLAIIGIDLALNAVLIGYAAYAANNYFEYIRR